MSAPRASDSGGTFSPVNIRGATGVILLAGVLTPPARRRRTGGFVKPYFTRLTCVAAVDLERSEALADRHELDDVDVHVRGLAGRPFDRGGDVVGGQRLGSGVDGAGLRTVAAEAHLRELGAAGQPGFDAGHPDSGAVQVGAQVEAELVHERLGRAVDVAARVGVGAGDRSEVD